MTEKCVVCQRIPPKIVFSTAHKVFNGKTDKQTIHKIAVDACRIINFADNKDRFFFCGRAQATILGGLFYLLSREYKLKVPQKDIALKLVPNKQGQTPGVSVAISYKRWYKDFPELFPYCSKFLSKEKP
jgi:hypothetical protein